jgi:flavin-dependent dehydrogenase
VSYVSALAWWLIPLGATVLAVGFVMLRSRPSKPTTAEDAMERLRRMQEAMERPLPSSGNFRVIDPNAPLAGEDGPDGAGSPGPERQDPFA